MESDYLLPHREAAWTLLTERLEEAASSSAGRSAAIAARWWPGAWPRS